VDSHVLITGTGRAGTSLLMQILTELGLDTGFKKGVKLDAKSNAGLERSIKDIDRWSYIVKNPEFCFEIPMILKEKEIDHVFICVRDAWDTALSRRENSRNNSLGGYWYADTIQEQIDSNDLAVHQLIQSIAYHDLQNTIICFDKMVEDCDYLWLKLTPLLVSFIFNETTDTYDAINLVSYEEFKEVYYRIVDKSKIKFK